MAAYSSSSATIVWVENTHTILNTKATKEKTLYMRMRKEPPRTLSYENIHMGGGGGWRVLSPMGLVSYRLLASTLLPWALWHLPSLVGRWGCVYVCMWGGELRRFLENFVSYDHMWGVSRTPCHSPPQKDAKTFPPSTERSVSATARHSQPPAQLLLKSIFIVCYSYSVSQLTINTAHIVL